MPLPSSKVREIIEIHANGRLSYASTHFYKRYEGDDTIVAAIDSVQTHQHLVGGDTLCVHKRYSLVGVFRVDMQGHLTEDTPPDMDILREHLWTPPIQQVFAGTSCGT